MQDPLRNLEPKCRLQLHNAKNHRCELEADKVFMGIKQYN
jgi:hypothetical protein